MDSALQPLVDRLNRLSDEFQELRDGVQKAIRIADEDPEMALTRSRKVLEYIIRDVFERHLNEPPGTRPLENLLDRLVKGGYFPARLDAYANTVRKLGNVGTHNFAEKVTAADVYQSLTQLIPILEWYFQVERPEAAISSATPIPISKEPSPAGGLPIPAQAVAPRRRDGSPIANIGTPVSGPAGRNVSHRALVAVAAIMLCLLAVIGFLITDLVRKRPATDATAAATESVATVSTTSPASPAASRPAASVAEGRAALVAERIAARLAERVAAPVVAAPAAPVAEPIMPTQSPGPLARPGTLVNTLRRAEELVNARRDQTPVRILEGHVAPVMHIVFTPDSTRLISTSNSHHLAVVRGRKIETAGNDNTVRVWDVASGKEISKFLVNEGHGYPAQGLCVSPDGRFMAVCTSAAFVRPDGKARAFVWEIATGQQTFSFLLQGNHAVRAIGYSADGRKLYVVRSGTRVHSFSMPEGVDTGAVILEGQSLREAPFGTILTPGCRFVLGGSWSGPIQLWDRQTGKPVKSFEGPSKAARSVAMSPRGTRVAAATEDLSLRVWDAASGQQIFGKQNLDSLVNSVAFSRDSKRLLTGGADGTVRIFDIATQKELRRWTGHTGNVTCVVYSPDGRLAASAGEDTTIRLWQLPRAPL